MVESVQFMDIVTRLTEQIKNSGFDHFGVARLERPISFPIYKEWIGDGRHGDMTYLEDHLPIKEDPRLLTRYFADHDPTKELRSAVVIAHTYVPHPHPDKRPLRTALYAEGADYHHWFLGALEDLKLQLSGIFPDEEFLCCTDTKPVMERDLARRAGLGWVGKNGCLIHPKKGSLFLLGEILTSLKIESEPSPLPDFCGRCDRCVRACPTQAIRDDRTLQADKCISYWTIESKKIAPPELRSQFADWFFGCDICQTVCPWNEKIFGRDEMRALCEPRSETPETIKELQFILTSSHKKLAKTYGASPWLRARPLGLKRNALVVIGNRKLTQLETEVRHLAETESRLADLADWTLTQIKA